MTSKTLSVTLGAALLALAATARADTARLVNPTNGHAYQRFDAFATWPDAKTACEAVGGYLATITSQAEQDWVWTTIGVDPGTPYNWLGGSSLNPSEAPPVWGAWVTGEAWGYTNWEAGFPNDSYGSAGTHPLIRPPGQWTNASGTGFTLHFICEWNPRYLAMETVFRASRPPAGTPSGTLPSFTITDYALLARHGDTFYLHLLNGYTGTIVASTLLGSSPAVTPRALTVTDHTGRALVTVLSNLADGSSTARVYDAGTAVLLRTITLPN